MITMDVMNEWRAAARFGLGSVQGGIGRHDGEDDGDVRGSMKGIRKMEHKRETEWVGSDENDDG